MEETNKKQFKVTQDLLVKFERRFLNYLIDVIVLSVILFIGLIFYIAGANTEEIKDFMNRFMLNSTLQFTITASITLVYYNLMEIFTSRTIGKFCTNTIVVDENGNKAGYEAVMIRSLIRIIPFYWISFIVFPTRGLHDIVSKTYVVNKDLLDERKKQFYAFNKV
ncbi:RDD family protein [Flavobacterium sp. AS60]|uniref:RDD family protein n=1 Tax=Flavobacterium anseongense TaxID=2910677 RepID=UPI001F193C1F|nr:RDD family protein [Flavobacterium sp. AS60]MCF6128519.1 RDD family protein [Flavobacterium sp. AS60]